MGTEGSFLVLVAVLVGTTALILFLRMVGVYGAATHDWAQTNLAKASAKVASTNRAGMEPALLVAILSAAAAIELGLDKVTLREVHELQMSPSHPEWPAHGRQLIFQSHRLRH